MVLWAGFPAFFGQLGAADKTPEENSMQQKFNQDALKRKIQGKTVSNKLPATAISNKLPQQNENYPPATGNATLQKDPIGATPQQSDESGQSPNILDAIVRFISEHPIKASYKAGGENVTGGGFGIDTTPLNKSMLLQDAKKAGTLVPKGYTEDKGMEYVNPATQSLGLTTASIVNPQTGIPETVIINKSAAAKGQNPIVGKVGETGSSMFNPRSLPFAAAKAEITAGASERRDLTKKQLQTKIALSDAEIIKQKVSGVKDVLKNIPSGRIKGTIALGKSLTGETGKSPVAQYNTYKAMTLSNMARTLGGERGVLTDADLLRVEKGFPKITDTEDERSAKINIINGIIDDAINSKLTSVQLPSKNNIPQLPAQTTPVKKQKSKYKVTILK